MSIIYKFDDIPDISKPERIAEIYFIMVIVLVSRKQVIWETNKITQERNPIILKLSENQRYQIWVKFNMGLIPELYFFSSTTDS